VCAGVARAAPPAAKPDRPDGGDLVDEGKSALWERTLRPHGDDYDARVARARTLIKEGDPAQIAAAERLLRQAAHLVPDEPAAHWWLGQLLLARGDHAGCAHSFGRVFELEPDFQPPEAKGAAPLALGLELSECLAQSGDYERAIAQLKRLLGQGHTDAPRIHWRLGALYMALGRLDDAIAALRTAHRQRPYLAAIEFALAVAYDRDERIAASRRHLRAGLRRDGSLTTLQARNTEYVPASDRFYQLALANRAKGAVPWAIIYFRQFVAEAPKSPWVRRARQHLDDLLAVAAPATRLTVHGSARVDAAKVRAAVAGATAALDRCMASAPGLLLRTRIIQVVGGRHAAARRLARPGRDGAGVRVLVDHAFGTRDEALRAAVACVGRVARDLPLPRPSGADGARLAIEFPVLAR
jgi:tetratricopeptide (TPR) repeat protein